MFTQRLAERGFLRIAMLIVGLALMVVGLGLGVTMIMLPVGIVVGLGGAALFVVGAVGDFPAT